MSEDKYNKVVPQLIQHIDSSTKRKQEEKEEVR